MSIRPTVCRPRTWWGALVAVASAAGAARAQEPGLPPRGAFVLGGGLDAFLRDGDRSTPQPTIHAGYEFPGLAARLGLGARTRVRLAGDFSTRAGADVPLRVDGQPAGTSFRAGRSTAGGVLLLARVPLAAGRGLTPYGLGGGGVFAVSGSQQTFGADGAPLPVARSTRVSPAVSAGLGVEGAAGRVTLFGEARATLLPNGTGGTPRLGRGVYLPLVLGVRF